MPGDDIDPAHPASASQPLPPFSRPYLDHIRQLIAIKKQLQQIQKKHGQTQKEVWTACRSLANPYEKLAFRSRHDNAHALVAADGRPIKTFMNRAAVKLAMLDAVLGLTGSGGGGGVLEPLAPGQPLLFADICGGPGGFTGMYAMRYSSRSDLKEIFRIPVLAAPARQAGRCARLGHHAHQ